MMGGKNRERERSGTLNGGYERTARNGSDGEMTRESEYAEGWEERGLRGWRRRSRERYQHKENEKRKEVYGRREGEREKERERDREETVNKARVWEKRIARAM